MPCSTGCCTLTKPLVRIRLLGSCICGEGIGREGRWSEVERLGRQLRPSFQMPQRHWQCLTGGAAWWAWICCQFRTYVPAA
jgi:hypothetical protein